MFDSTVDQRIATLTGKELIRLGYTIKHWDGNVKHPLQVHWKPRPQVAKPATTTIDVDPGPLYGLLPPLASDAYQNTP